MSDLPIRNETEYALSDLILKQIERDALEYFGESVRLIRIQYGIDRHAFNARSGELRYAFSPVDFGFTGAISEPGCYFGDDVRRIDFEEDETVDDGDYEDIDVREEEVRETSLEALAEKLEEDEEEDIPHHQLLVDEFDEARKEIDFMDESN
ncbi:MAG: hypothetical protein O7G88_14450 [bacterium]|nr:hypothetical protein [bacterium]